jgi:flagellar biosynthesis protein FliR
MAGLCIGGIAAASAQALRWTGRVAGEQMGLALGGVAAPGDDSGEANAVESVMGWCAAATFVAVGGIEAVVLAAARSRAGVTGAWMASVRGWSGTLDAAMQVGLRACLPVLAVTLAGTAIGGVIMRAAPRAVTLAGGFGARAAMGLGMLAAGAGTAWALQTELVRGAIARLSQVGGA